MDSLTSDIFFFSKEGHSISPSRWNYVSPQRHQPPLHYYCIAPRPSGETSTLLHLKTTGMLPRPLQQIKTHSEQLETMYCANTIKDKIGGKEAVL